MTDRPLDLPLAVPLDGPSGDLESTLPNLIAARRNILRLLPRGGPALVAVLALVNLVLGVLPVVFVIATSVLLGRVPAAVRAGLDSPAWHALTQAFLVAAIAFVAQQIIAPAAASLGALLARRVDREVYDELMAASLSSAGIAPLEDQEVQDELRVAGLKLEYAIQSPGSACAGILALIARYVQLIGFVVVMGVALSWLAAFGLLVAVLFIRHGMRGGLSRYADERRRLAAAERKGYYVRDLAMGSWAGKEIRIFGLADWVRHTYRQVYLIWLRPLWAARRRTLLWGFLAFAVWGFLGAAVVLGGIGAAATGAASLTSFALVAQAALGAIRLSGYYPEADMQTAIGISGYDQVQRFAARVRAFPTPRPGGRHPGAGPAVPPAVPDPVATIHFDHVTFGYPGQELPIFDGLDLTIPVGRCTAIVGSNGVGKTTLVKLLARLYEPTSGAIRVDGVDIRDYPVEQWRAKIAVILQDFLRYEASAADNIGFGAIDNLDDTEGIRAAAESVGIADVLDALPHGMDTPLARHLTGGAELSGGQWQRVALARALFGVRHGSPVVILDEPTASLDMRAEASFFDQFSEITRGATTLLISHRFSTVRHADLIVVLDEGRVIEQGGHDDLMARGGRYAHLFRLQGDLAGGTDLTGGTDSTGGTAQTAEVLA